MFDFPLENKRKFEHVLLWWWYATETDCDLGFSQYRYRDRCSRFDFVYSSCVIAGGAGVFVRVNLSELLIVDEK